MKKRANGIPYFVEISLRNYHSIFRNLTEIMFQQEMFCLSCTPFSTIFFYIFICVAAEIVRVSRFESKQKFESQVKTLLSSRSVIRLPTILCV